MRTTSSRSRIGRGSISAPRYTTAINGRKTVFRANIQNVTGTTYWSSVASFGTFFLGAPRTYLLSMTVDM
ncbi:outer membrane receptor protein involved in Fe transport [Bradyrhizobium diazoefficiens]